MDPAIQNYLISWILPCFTVIFVQTASGSQCPNITFPAVFNATETDEPGTVVWQYNVTETIQNNWNISDGKDYLSLDVNGSIYSIETVKSLELDDFVNRGCIAKQTIAITLYCSSNTAQQFKSELHIQPVNEHPPKFLYAPYDVNVSENTEIGKTIFSLEGKVQDYDCPKHPFVYTTQSFEIIEFDGREYFGVNETAGAVYLKKQVDADSLRCLSRSFYMLKVVAKDGDPISSKEDSTRLNITIVEIDDEPPVFVTDSSCHECTHSCRVQSYTSEISTDYEGTLDVVPANIFATDYDTKNSSILYRVVNAQPQNLSILVELDPVNGNVTVPVAPANFSNLTFTEDVILTITIQALENTTQQVSDSVTLTITFTIPVPTTTEETTTTTLPTTEQQITTDTTETMTTTQNISITETHSSSNSPIPSPTSSPLSTSSSKSTSKPSTSSDELTHGTNVLVIVLPVVFGVLIIIMIAAIIIQYKRTLPSKGRTYQVENGQLSSKHANGAVELGKTDLDKKDL